MGRRAKLPDHWLGRLHLAGPVAAAPPAPDGAPAMAVLPAVFDQVDSWARAAAVRALEASWAAFARPVGASGVLQVPEDAPAALVHRLWDTASDVLSAYGVPLYRAAVPRGSLALWSLSMAGQRAGGDPFPRRPPRKGRVVLSRPLGSDLMFQLYVEHARTPAQTRAWARSAGRTQPELESCLVEGRSLGAVQVGVDGLAGAAWSLAELCGCDVVLDASRFPSLPGVVEALLSGVGLAGATANRKRFGRRVSVARGVPDAAVKLLMAPEWTGGLLVVVADRDGDLPGTTEVGELRPRRADRPIARVFRSL